MRHCILALFIIPLIVLLMPACSKTQAPEDDSAREANWLNLDPAEKRPEQFEPYLRTHPRDVARRTAALVWYSRREKDIEKLKQHTREMIKYHPTNMHIFFANSSIFFLDPEFRLETIRLLEKHLNEGQTDHGVYWNLALACEQAGIPRVGDDATSKQRFLRYYGLPQETELPTEIDAELSDKAVRYFKSAIAASQGDDFHMAFYSQQLADLLMALNKPNEAVDVCEKALPHIEDTSRPDFLVSYGECLYQSGKASRAKDILSQVRRCDTEGFEGGPGHATAAAETKLGFIAMDQGDIESAKKYLLSSCNVQKCCHNITKGLSLNLARKLLDAGECDAVAHYCRQILDKFTPDQEETKGLLRRALEEKGKAKRK